MSNLKKATKMYSNGDSNYPLITGKLFNPVANKLNELSVESGVVNVNTISEKTSGSGVTVDGVLIKDGGITVTSQILSTNVVEKTIEVTIDADQIVGTDAGDLGHTDGVPLVAAQPGITYELTSAVLIYDFDTAAYTGASSDDLVIRQGSTSVTSAIADADLLLATADKIVFVNSLAAADIAFTANSTLNIKSTAVTQPGTAAGVIRVNLTYKEHTTGL